MSFFFPNIFPDWFNICLNTHFDQSVSSNHKFNLVKCCLFVCFLFFFWSFFLATYEKSLKILHHELAHETFFTFFSLQNIWHFQLVGYNEEVLDVKFMGKNGSHIAVASNSEQIRVFELASHSCQILTGHTDIVLELAVFKKGLVLASCSKVSWFS